MSTSFEEVENYKPRTRVYGHRDSFRPGSREDVTRCYEEVWDNFDSYQCHRKRGYGYKGLFCKQHAKRYKSYVLLTDEVQGF